MAVLGTDITEVCADMAVKVPQRRNVEGGPPIASDQVDNMIAARFLGKPWDELDESSRKVAQHVAGRRHRPL